VKPTIIVGFQNAAGACHPMKVFRGLPNAEARRPCALTIGNFDGVHRGHRALLARVSEAAARLRGRARSDGGAAIPTRHRDEKEETNPGRASSFLNVEAPGGAT
jgi:hypothetical protein